MIPEHLKHEMQLLQFFQTRRLRQTYADFSEQPEFAGLVEFFFSQIYGTQDFGFRNESIKTLHHRLSGFLHGEIINSVGHVIELNDLTEKLDLRMSEAMKSRNITAPLDMETYAALYRSLDNFAEREYQIDLMLQATRAIHRISRMWLIGITLKAVSKAAHLAGYGKIMDFLEHGYAAFHRVRNIQPFVDAVETREKALNAQLFGKTSLSI